MNFDFILSPINIFIFLSEGVFLWWLITILNNKIFINLHKVYNENQKIHSGFVSKAGGLGLLFSISLYLLVDIEKENISFLNYLVISSLPVIFIGTLEDFFNNIKPRVRLYAIFLSAFILVQYPEMIFPVLDLPVLSQFFLIYPFTFIAFLIIAITVLVNGINMIDGVNGLMLATVFFVISSLYGISIHLGDADFVAFYSLVMVITVPLIFFNYPFQKIFSGDMGAYLLGLMIGFSVILLYGKYPEHITWEVPLILFYPSYEVLFTMLRRYKDRQKATKADTKHLHQIIFFFYNSKFKDEKLANNLVMPTLIPISISPFLFFYFLDFALTFNQAIFALIFMVCLYHVYYFMFSKLIFSWMHK